MLCDLRWLNTYLDPAIGPDEAESVLMGLGFPIETRTEAPGGGWVLDVEVTSNRGDCLAYLGLAREISARTGRRVKDPAAITGVPEAGGGSIGVSVLSPEACPRFTARVIRGVRVGPSPAWLREALERIGQRSISNVVDATNFVAFETGNPSHAFDLRALEGGRLVVRWAEEGEPLTTLDGKKRTLRADELVVADAARARSLAGVIGGEDSEVTAATTDVVLEVATWDPIVVRRAARRHQVRTDASHRFERRVDPRTLDAASARATALIIEVAGGTADRGLIGVGEADTPEPIRLRPGAVARTLGYPIDGAETARLLSALRIGVRDSGNGELLCVPPPGRLDLTREIDLVEEVARLKGLEAVPVRETLPVSVRAAQGAERGRREAGAVLAGLGFFEAVTFSFAARGAAGLFLEPGASLVEVDDTRRAEEPALRPSVLTGLLACRRANHDARVRVEGGVRLFEVASVFEQNAGGAAERRRLAVLADVPGEGPRRTVEQRQAGVRIVRGAIEAVVRALGGSEAALGVEPAAGPRAFDPVAYARLSLNGAPIGGMGLLSPEASAGLETPVAGGEVDLEPLLATFPPRAVVRPLPQFPAIERDLSVVVEEGTAWERIERVAAASRPAGLESVVFVGTYRGKQAGPGRKSVTLRLTFRDAARTLTHGEVDGPVAGVVDALKRELGAELRA